MTTLFPQIKRVDEDETSKIIKNVLFNNHDEVKLEQIFDEFMNLTKERITFSDDDDDDDEDAPDDDGPDEDEENDEDDENEDDEEDDDSDSDSDSDESDSDSDSESEEEKPEPPASREPTSWNLDQFIRKIPPVLSPVPSPVPPQPQQHQSHHQPQPKAKSRPEPEPKPVVQAKQEPQPQVQAKPEPKPQVQAKQEPKPQIQPKPEPQPQVLVKQEPQPNQLSSSSSSSTASSSNHLSSGTPQPSSNYLVQIDLSKLKRIPTTKAPTPTSCSSNSILTAKALKHEADAEKDKTKQAIKYLESAMYFVLHGYELETLAKNYGYYHDTIPLFKHAMRLSTPGSENSDNMTSLKVHTLCLRCLSLLHMKIYKCSQRELYENNRIINSQQNSSPMPQPDSSLVGVRPQLLSAYKRQLVIFNHLKYATDYWQQADQFCDQHPAVRIFFSTIESNCGSLKVVSPFTKLMEHVKCGLKLLRS